MFSNKQISLIIDESDVEKEWVGMPEYIQERTEHHCIKVSFVSKEDMVRFSRLIGQEITLKTKIIYYPTKLVQSSAGKKYKDEP